MSDAANDRITINEALHRIGGCKKCEHLALQYEARKALNKAVRLGEIARGDCEHCGAENRDGKKSHGHHTDYTKPLDVMWLCRGCHQDLHTKERREKGFWKWARN